MTKKSDLKSSMSGVNYKDTAPSRPHSLVFTKPSRTVRSQAYEADINRMVKGQTPFTVSKRKPFYIDETVLPDYYEAAFNTVLAAQSAFMTLPPRIRQMFGNDPAQLSRALADPALRHKLIELGIIQAPAPGDEKGESPPSTAPAQPNPAPADAGAVKEGQP